MAPSKEDIVSSSNLCCRLISLYSACMVCVRAGSYFEKHVTYYTFILFIEMKFACTGPIFLQITGRFGNLGWVVSGKTRVGTSGKSGARRKEKG